MDQALFIVTQIQSAGITITSIQAVGTGIGVVISTLIMWGLMTKNINKRIEGKADEKVTDARFKKVESEINNNKSEYKVLLLMQQDTNTKVTEIWKFLAEKK